MSTVLFSASSYGFNWARNVRSDLRSRTRNGAPEPARLKIPPLVLLNVGNILGATILQNINTLEKIEQRVKMMRDFSQNLIKKDAKGIFGCSKQKVQRQRNFDFIWHSGGIFICNSVEMITNFRSCLACAQFCSE